MQVAETILDQLGGNRFRVMTGATRFVGSDNELMFLLPDDIDVKDGIRKVVIRLDPSDTYTLLGYRRFTGPGDLEPVAEVSNVYAEDLQRIFTSVTGLHTRL